MSAYDPQPPRILSLEDQLAHAKWWYHPTNRQWEKDRKKGKKIITDLQLSEARRNSNPEKALKRLMK